VLPAANLHRRSVYVLAGLSACLLSAGCQPTGFLITPVPADKSLQQRELSRTSFWAADKIALIDVDGLLLNGESFTLLGEGENPVSFFVEKLQAAEKDKRIKGLVLRVNSPGGTVTASEIMHHEIRNYKQRTGRPVVTVMTDVAASGGYYVACASDYLIAYPTTVTGSIGVLVQMFNLAGTLAKIGVETDAVKSGPNKDAGSPLRRMSPEERAIFQSLIDQFYEQFLTIVRAGRPNIDAERLRELADGRVYSATQALDAGLIDRIGTMHDAVAEVKERAGLKDYRLITFHRPFGWKSTVYAAAPQRPPTQVNLISLDLSELLCRSASPQFMYLWQPGP